MTLYDDDYFPNFKDFFSGKGKKDKKSSFKERLIEELNLLIFDQQELKIPLTVKEPQTLFETNKEIELLCIVTDWIFRLFHQENELPEDIKSYLNEIEFEPLNVLRNIQIDLKKANDKIDNNPNETVIDKQNEFRKVLKHYFPKINPD